MSRGNTIQIFEHQILKIGQDGKFKSRHFKSLEAYGYNTKEKYFTVGNRKIKFKQYVGVFQVDDLTIEVLPKADKSSFDSSDKRKWHKVLINMLKECNMLKIDAVNKAHLSLKSSTLLDLYFDSFLTEAEKVYKQGLRKDYRRVSSNLNKVKGKICFPNHLRKNLIHKEKFWVEHQVFDPDNKLNQIVFKAITILSKLNRNASHSIRIKRLLLNFEDVSEKQVDESWFKNLKYNRNTERYKQVITLSKMIILQYSPDFQGGNNDVLSIVFDMNKLFEKYVFKKLKELEKKETSLEVTVREQNKKAFWQSQSLIADILLETPNGNLVIDTKWKVLNSLRPDDGDLKQMFAYNIHYDSTKTVLLYPQTHFETQPQKRFEHPEFNDKFCQLAFVNITDSFGNLSKNLGVEIYNELLN